MSQLRNSETLFRDPQNNLTLLNKVIKATNNTVFTNNEQAQLKKWINNSNKNRKELIRKINEKMKTILRKNHGLFLNNNNNNNNININNNFKKAIKNMGNNDIQAGAKLLVKNKAVTVQNILNLNQINTKSKIALLSAIANKQNSEQKQEANNKLKSLLSQNNHFKGAISNENLNFLLRVVQNKSILENTVYPRLNEQGKVKFNSKFSKSPTKPPLVLSTQFSIKTILNNSPRSSNEKVTKLLNVYEKNTSNKNQVLNFIAQTVAASPNLKNNQTFLGLLTTRVPQIHSKLNAKGVKIEKLIQTNQNKEPIKVKVWREPLNPNRVYYENPNGKTVWERPNQAINNGIVVLEDPEISEIIKQPEPINSSQMKKLEQFTNSGKLNEYNRGLLENLRRRLIKEKNTGRLTKNTPIKELNKVLYTSTTSSPKPASAAPPAAPNTKKPPTSSFLSMFGIGGQSQKKNNISPNVKNLYITEKDKEILIKTFKQFINLLSDKQTNEEAKAAIKSSKDPIEEIHRFRLYALSVLTRVVKENVFFGKGLTRNKFNNLSVGNSRNGAQNMAKMQKQRSIQNLKNILKNPSNYRFTFNEESNNYKSLDQFPQTTNKNRVYIETKNGKTKYSSWYTKDLIKARSELQ